MNRISTGIVGLDEMLKGGLIEGRPYTVIGGPGSGKSLLGWQFLREGVRAGGSSLYVTLDEPFYEIKENTSALGIFEPGIRIMDLSPEEFSREGEVSALSFLDRELPLQLRRLKPDRVVFDSITTVKALEADLVTARRRILSLMRSLSRKGNEGEGPITSILIAESSEEKLPLEAYLARGVVLLHNRMIKGSMIRAISITKMRGTRFDERLRPLRIDAGGMEVIHTETLLNDI